MLTLFNLAVNFLTQACGATVVLCSATQPSLEETQHPLYQPPEEMVPYDADLWAAFRRTRLRYGGSFRLEEIPAFALGAMEGARSLLIICNTKKQAATLFNLLEDFDGECYHLSAAMCSAHRQQVLAEIRAALQVRRRVICVATQVIEAGVDISFSRVIRFTAGMESAVQAAGRCNRNGELEGGELAPVYLVRIVDEDLRRLSDMKEAQRATEELLEDFPRHPQDFDEDLASSSAIAYYYRCLYRNLNRSAGKLWNSRCPKRGLPYIACCRITGGMPIPSASPLVAIISTKPFSPRVPSFRYLMRKPWMCLFPMARAWS